MQGRGVFPCLLTVGKSRALAKAGSHLKPVILKSMNELDGKGWRILVADRDLTICSPVFLAVCLDLLFEELQAIDCIINPSRTVGGTIQEEYHLKNEF